MSAQFTDSILTAEQPEGSAEPRRYNVFVWVAVIMFGVTCLTAVSLLAFAPMIGSSGLSIEARSDLLVWWPASGIFWALIGAFFFSAGVPNRFMVTLGTLAFFTIGTMLSCLFLLAVFQFIEG